jgi:SRSO17 transposase
LPKARKIPHARTKLKIALQLVQKAVEEGWPFRAVVADNFYGEDRGLKRGLRELGVPYVMALKPSHAWYHPEEVAGTLQDVAHEAGWQSAKQEGEVGSPHQKVPRWQYPTVVGVGDRGWTVRARQD